MQMLGSPGGFGKKGRKHACGARFRGDNAELLRLQVFEHLFRLLDKVRIG